MRQQMQDDPVGALSAGEVRALGYLPGTVIYKVYGSSDPHLRAFTVVEFHPQHDAISGEYKSEKSEGGITISMWYGENKMGYLFTNYFHWAGLPA